MATDERRKRPDLDRIGPIRDFSRIFGPPPAEPNGHPHGAANPGSPTRPEGVGRGVTLGYQVIDDYIRQGEEFARTMYSAAGVGAAAAAAPSSREAFDPQAMTSRLVQAATDFAGVWMDLVQATAGRGVDRPRNESRPGVPGFDINQPAPTVSSPAAPPVAAAAAASSAPAPSAPGDGAAASWRAPVTLDVDSKRPLQIAVDIKPGVDGAGLIAHALRAIDPAAPRIDGIEIDRLEGEDGLLVRLRVSDDQPPGVYSGIVVDERTNLPRGTLYVRVLDRQVTTQRP